MSLSTALDLKNESDDSGFSADLGKLLVSAGTAFSGFISRTMGIDVDVSIYEPNMSYPFLVIAASDKAASDGVLELLKRQNLNLTAFPGISLGDSVCSDEIDGKSVVAVRACPQLVAEFAGLITACASSEKNPSPQPVARPA